MNTLESCIIQSPSGNEEECAKFTIEETLSPFVLHNITMEPGQYTLSLWVRSENEGSIVSRGLTMPSSTEWVKYKVTFNTEEPNLDIFFNTVDTYYIYKPKLEMGSKDTDWTEAPEDLNDRIEHAQDTANDAQEAIEEIDQKIISAESMIQQLNYSISMLVTSVDEEGTHTSLMEQTADGGWTFSTADVEASIRDIQAKLSGLDEHLGETSATVEVLDGSITDVSDNIRWIKMTEYEGEACIALGSTESDFKLLITPTRIMFFDGTDVPAYITNKALNITKAIIKEELQQGPFVWTIRSSGNMGLIWKGVSE